MSLEEIATEIRPARVKYYDLCQHTGVSRETFFNDCGLKILSVFGLTLEMGGLVRVMFNDDESDNGECEGIIIPAACVIEIDYLAVEKIVVPQDKETVN